MPLPLLTVGKMDYRLLEIFTTTSPSFNTTRKRALCAFTRRLKTYKELALYWEKIFPRRQPASLPGAG